jgi:hypothetical protein
MKRNTWILILVIAILGLLLWSTREHFKDDNVTLQADGSQDPNAQNTTSSGGDIQSSYLDTSLASVSTDGTAQTSTDSSLAGNSSYVSDPSNFQSSAIIDNSAPTVVKDDTVTFQPASASTLTVNDSSNSGGFQSAPAVIVSDPSSQYVVDYAEPARVYATPSVAATPMFQQSTLDAPILVAPPASSAPITTDASTITQIAAQAAAQAVAQTTPPAPAPAPAPTPAPTVNINTAPTPAASPTTTNATPISAPGVASYTSVCSWTKDASNTPVSSCQWYK